jgi:carboxyl-terminal processing protease
MPLSSTEKIRTILPLLLALSLAAGTALGYWLFNQNDRKSTVLSGKSKFVDFLQLLEMEYVDSLNTKDLTEDAIRNILASLDPHSVYIPAEEAELSATMLESDFEGIGIEFQMVKDTLQIISLNPGGPAAKAGLLLGDRIISAGNQRISGPDAAKLAFELIRGKKGTGVKLLVYRPGLGGGHFRREVLRDVIPSVAVDAAFMLDRQTAYLKINRFSESSYNECIDSLNSLDKQGMKALVLDLRDNTGGYLDKATRLADEFLGGKELLVYTRGRSDRYNQEYFSSPGGSRTTLPLILLVNEGTASASEILAGAIQDHDRGLIVGRRTFGKGLVQVPLGFEDGSEMRLTISRYFTPSGRCIQKPYNAGNYDQDLDNRLANGELFAEDSIRPDRQQLYKTAGGRTVYGGGGIIPDVFVSLDTVGVNSFISDLMEQNLFREFALAWKHKNPVLAENIRKKSAVESFNPGDAILLDFVAFAGKRGIHWPENRQKLSTDIFLSHTIKSYIADQIWGSQAYYRIFSGKDPCIRQALNLIPKARKMLRSTN